MSTEQNLPVITAGAASSGLPNGNPFFAVFHHLTTPKAAEYRAILRVFVSAKERFEVALRPREVAERLASDATWPHGAEESLDEATVCLAALREWGNLTATRDFVSARTLDEYLHPRYLYQLTLAGETAERALLFFEQGLKKRGELSTSALHEISETLKELYALASATALDEAKTVRALEILVTRFDALVARAQSFVGSLQHELDRPGTEESTFLALKEELIKYLDRFVRELVSATFRISATLQSLDELNLELVFSAAAQADLANALSPSADERQQAVVQWRTRWSGVRRWFIGAEGEPSQAEALRARALAAIPTLLERVRRFHDQRANRADRSTDFLTLARWFATAPTDADLHRLWRTAFGLNSARHMRVNDATLTAWADLPDGARPAWEESPPFVIAIAQWERGRLTTRGAPPGIINRAVARAALRAQAEKERLILRAACKNLAARSPTTLSQLGKLDPQQLDLLLDALGEAFAQMGPTDTTGEAATTDGSLQISVRLPVAGTALAALVTPDGALTGPDIHVTLRYSDDE
jgi:uncharacterized protein (TIGR02677 family)